MAEESRLTKFLNKRTWIVPVLFAMMIALLVLAIAAFETRRYAVELGNLQPLNTDFAFSIGGELCAMFVAVMMSLSILPSYKRQSGYIRIFFTLLTVGCLCLFFDTLQMLSDGIPALAMTNKVLCIFVFINEVAYLFFFYLYSTYALSSEGRHIQILNAILSGAAVIFMLLPFVNLFYPLYFTIDEATGVYARNVNTWWICRVFLALVVIGAAIATVLSKEKLKKKLVVMTFLALPVLSIAAGGFKYGVSILYTAMMVSLVLIYAFIFSNHEKHLYSTSKELTLATRIQKTMLPSIFPAFPERKEFDVYASMEPAKEVGGDFYDFFLIDDNHLGMVVADVSDKGVPAALFMMASKIMVQNYAMLGISPKEVLTKVNRQICSNNQSEMFVTIWLGVLDIRTGILTASNAGHEKPILKKGDGQFEVMNDVHGFVVGWNPDAIYKDYKIKLDKGAKLFLYTDGVPEASNKDGQFGMNRTVDALNKFKDSSPAEILNSMLKELVDFMGNFDQFDDITMLCLEYRGFEEENIKFSKAYPAEIEKIDEMIKPVLAFLKEKGVDGKATYKVNLALEEVLTNVCLYAYAPEKGEVNFAYEYSPSSKEIAFSIADKGKEFNPLEAKEPELDASVEDRQIGGLGIFLTKKIMDELSYRRENNENILIMKKKF